MLFKTNTDKTRLHNLNDFVTIVWKDKIINLEYYNYVTEILQLY